MSQYISFCSSLVGFSFFFNSYLNSRITDFIGSLKYFTPCPRTLMMTFFMKMISGLTKMGKIHTYRCQFYGMPFECGLIFNVKHIQSGKGC